MTDTPAPTGGIGHGSTNPPFRKLRLTDEELKVVETYETIMSGTTIYPGRTPKPFEILIRLLRRIDAEYPETP